MRFTNSPVKRRTIGKNINTVGKAIIHENSLTSNHFVKNASNHPTFFHKLIIEIVALINPERKNGINQLAYFAGNLGILPTIIVDFACIIPTL